MSEKILNVSFLYFTFLINSIYPFLEISYKNWTLFTLKKLDIFTKEINVDKFQIFDPPPRKKVFS